MKIPAILPKKFQSSLTLSYIGTPSQPLSNCENRASIAISVAELLKKQPSPLYFEMDNSNHWLIDHRNIDTFLKIVPGLSEKK